MEWLFDHTEDKQFFKLVVWSIWMWGVDRDPSQVQKL